MNHPLTIVKRVENAMRGTAPVVGIPQEGEAPFCVRRSLLVESLRGLKIIDAGVQLALDGKREHARLVIYAASDRVKAMRSFAPLERNTFLLAQWDWADKQRIRRQPKPKVSACEKRIVRLQKQLAKLGELKRPWHYLVDQGERWLSAKSRREHDARELKAWREMTAEGTEMQRPLTAGESWARWKAEARVRRWIQLQARLTKAGKMTTTQLYRVLAERGIRVRKWSELRMYDKDHCHDLFGYLACLWEFCGLARKPWGFEAEDVPELGVAHYASWIEHLHARKELESMIAAVEAI